MITQYNFNNIRVIQIINPKYNMMDVELRSEIYEFVSTNEAFNRNKTKKVHIYIVVNDTDYENNIDIMSYPIAVKSLLDTLVNMTNIPKVIIHCDYQCKQDLYWVNSELDRFYSKSNISKNMIVVDKSSSMLFGNGVWFYKFRTLSRNKPLLYVRDSSRVSNKYKTEIIGGNTYVRV